MADEDTGAMRSRVEFSEAQLTAITGVVQRLLDRALTERGSGPAPGGTGSSSGATAGSEAAGESSRAVPGKWE